MDRGLGEISTKDPANIFLEVRRHRARTEQRGDVNLPRSCLLKQRGDPRKRHVVDEPNTLRMRAADVTAQNLSQGSRDHANSVLVLHNEQISVSVFCHETQVGFETRASLRVTRLTLRPDTDMTGGRS